MLTDSSGRAEEGLPGLNFAEVLRQSLACAMLVIDDQMRITAFNAEAERLMNLEAGQVLNQSVALLPTVVQGILQETFSTGKPIRQRQVVLPSKQGEGITIYSSTAFTRNDKGRISGAILILNDLTATRRLEKNLQHLDRLASIGTLSASMGHEIKNALVAVKTFVDLLLKRNQDAELAGIVAREMQRIDSIVCQMLRFAGPAKPTFAPVPIHEILDQSLHLIEHQIEGKKIVVRRDYTTAADVVKGDSYQLQQAFLNLFFNALEAMGADGQLRLATAILPPDAGVPKLPGYKNQPILSVAVSDTGIGIPAENMERLFEPFFTTKPSGTGLGLSITRRIIRDHQGVIIVKSDLNQGTTFTALLPMAPR